MPSRILSFTDSTLATAGGKAANLGRLVAGEFRVPDGFVIAADAYRDAVAGLDLAALLASDKTAHIRDLVESQPLPADLLVALRDRMSTWGDGVAVAVRSSATAEDLPEASFAGQQDTFLGVCGVEAVADAVRRCWGSLWTERAVTYRERNSISHDDVAIAVIVQRLVDAEIAGVMFTADPVTGADETIINASWGLGESVVSGLVTPDEYRVASGKISVRVGAKESRLDRVGTDVVRTSDPRCADAQCLSEEQVRELDDVGHQIHDHFGMPMDIEWAIDDDGLWILQARPITTIAGETVATQRDAQPTHKHSRLSRAFHHDLIEHYPSPFPLDLLAITRVHEQLQFGMEQVGVRSTPIADLITMDADGVITVDYPAVRFTPRLLRLLRYPSPDPGGWPEVERGYRDRLRAIGSSPADAPTSAIIEALRQTLDLVDEIARARFLDYLGPAMLLATRLGAMLRLARRPDLSPYDLLGDLDYTTAVIDRELRRLAALPPGAETEKQIQQFLAEYGARTPKMYLPFSQRSWREDPELFAQTLAAARRQSAAPRTGSSHDEVVASVTRRLPRFARRRFLRMVERWRAGHVAREASLYLIEETYVHARALMDLLAERLVDSGHLAHRDGAKMLAFDEIVDALNGKLAADEMRRRVAARTQARPRSWPRGGSTMLMPVRTAQP
ncbi:hypothetical protein H8R18_07570 [Nanchangia anserum]|uniref:PEP/pyruvate-binding domain-containing protein n=1 Tax=Nanchangia anserum TaxID=2692125 RepID=UPI001883D8BE|nr:PEP/pyruvate-binding domain-containing protein [Nanchangia anserum]QOX81589.1 hypothetical protein H8R18_07570 [Nanchangia anserum]